MLAAPGRFGFGCGDRRPRSGIRGNTSKDARVPTDDTDEMPQYIPVMARLQLLQALADRGDLSRAGQIEHYRLACWLASYSELQRQAAGIDVDEFMKCCERSATPENQ